jgi:DNA-binding CsgD family transcriptional regulator
MTSKRHNGSSESDRLEARERWEHSDALNQLSVIGLTPLVNLQLTQYSPFVAARASGDLLIGRESELSKLTGWAHDAVTGLGRAVLVEGEPGIGKSSLARAACARAERFGCQVFWGAGDELGQALPLLPLLDALQIRESGVESRRTTIVRLMRGEVTGRDADLSAAGVEQVLALVHELCAIAPTMLVVDELQWADPATVTVWERLARSIANLPLLLVGIMRPVPQRDTLAAVRHLVGSSRVLRLGPLVETAVEQLVEALAGAKPGEELLRLADGAAGNPLYLTELVGSLSRSDCLAITDAGVAEVVNDTKPNSLAAAIADRLGFLHRSTRDVLRAAALLGVGFSVSDLAAVSGHRVTDLLPALDEARAAGVLSAADGGLAFRHPLIRTALYDEMPPAVRAAWHQDAGRALAKAGAPVDRVARQLLRAFDGDDDAMPATEWVVHWLVDAAPLLIGQSPPAAAGLLRRVVSNLPAGATRHDVLACRLAEALYRVGDTIEAEHVATQALKEVDDPDLLVDLHCTLTYCRSMTGRSAESLDALEEALTFEGTTSAHRARLLVLKARTHRNLGQVETAGQVADAALAEATETGDRWSIGWALFVQRSVAFMRGESAEALALIDRALAVTEGHADLTDLRLLLQINQAMALSELDQRDEALTVIERARQLANHTGNAVRITQAHSALGQLLFDTGHWDEALAEVDERPENLKEPALTCCDHGVAAVISFHRGDTATAERHLAAAAPAAERIGNRVIGFYAQARSLAAEQAGATSDALAVLTAGLANDAEELVGIEDVLGDAVRLAVEVGDRATAIDLAARIEVLAREENVTHRRAAALYSRGLIDKDSTQLLQAAELYAIASLPLPRAQALEAAAVAFLEGDDRTSARAAFVRAFDIYTELDATWDIARLRDRFRPHGIRRGPRGKRTAAGNGWSSLTPTEAKIAALVVQGMSNRQVAAQLFLSPRTVATHVSHILNKLGLRSRIDIAREAGRQYSALG